MLFCLFVIFVASLLYMYHSRALRRRMRVVIDLPEVTGALPFVGNALRLMGGPNRMLENIKEICEEILNKGGLGKILLGHNLYIVALNPEDIQKVLENCLQKDWSYRFLQTWLGNGLFVAPVDMWKVHRRVLLPIFQNRVIEDYIEVIGEQGSLLADRLSEQVGKGEFDVFPYITSCTLDIVFETAMGERMNVQNNPDTPYLRARHTVMSIINMRIFKVWLHSDYLFNLSSYSKELQDNIQTTHAFTDKVIKKKREEYENNNGKAKGRRELLMLLFGREIDFSDEQLREHIDSITIAGNDTTALVIAYTLVLLGVHQDAQQKLYMELQDIFGDSKRSPTKEDLAEMRYLERVIKESMRLYTVVPLLARAVDKDLQLSKCTLPAGANVVMAPFVIHRSKCIWGEDADQFNPDRFLPEFNAKRHPCAFMPFSYGSRNCIGRRFGMMIMKSILATTIRNYKVTARECGKLKIEILLFPVDGHLISLERR